ncbi:MAG TPA: glycosyl hydrolase family 8 [Acetivibrio sp.]|nr:glycosyl hydrolase family 8 [Acetivibrio sp.]HPT90603.1 glycosyl hydrolase family 8 [Acetivibrio sp.]
MKRYISTVICITVFAIILAGIIHILGRRAHEDFPMAASGIFLSENNKYRDKEQDLLQFVRSCLMGPSGEVVTNSCPENGDASTLAESIGILLNYSLLNDDRSMFEKEYRYFEKELVTKDLHIKWKSGEDVTCNASIDDLRIIGALFGAYEKWGDEKYFQVSLALQQKLYDCQVKGGNLYQLYDWKYDSAKESTPLCYLDLKTLRKLMYYNKDWEEVYERSLAIVSGGRIEGTPFFYKYYDFKSGEYILDEEYNEKRSICLLYTLYTALNLAEEYFQTDELLSWLEKEMNDRNRLYAWYDPHSKEPVSEMESTAVYALASVYARLSGKNLLSDKFLDRMLQLMVDDRNSKYYGGFGNSETGEFYSFDNLTALWALALTR